MDRLPLVVSFYTLDTPYEEEAKGLLASCERFAIEHLIEGVSSKGSWEMNCAFKPLFLLQKLEELKRPLLWVDADAIFCRPIEQLPLFSLDVGVRLYECSDDHPSRVVSSLVFINATEGGRKVLRLWAQKCLLMLQNKSREEEVWDQEALRDVLFKEEHGSNWGGFSAGYSVIPGHPEDEKVLEKPTLVQNQVSRLYKKWI
jgi:hypothetical protein